MKHDPSISSASPLSAFARPRLTNVGRSLYFAELFIGIVIVVVFFGVFISTALVRDALPPSSLSADFRYYLTDTRLTSEELASVGREWPLLTGKIEAKTRYAYVRADVYNGEAGAREIVLGNDVGNEYTELLEQRLGGAVTLFRHGDSVPLSESPIRHHTAAFPIVIPSRVAVSYIIEYFGSRRLLLAPSVATWSEWHARASYERGLLFLYFGALFLLLTLNVFIFSLGLRRFFAPFIALTVSTASFYMGQTRFLSYLIDPFPIPAWFFPVAISASLSSVMLLFRAVFEDRYARRERSVMLAVIVVSTALACASLLKRDVFSANVPYVPMPVGFAVVIIAAVKAKRARAREPVVVVLSLLPWTLVLLVGGTAFLIGGRLSFPREALSPLSFLFSIGLLTVSRQYLASQQLLGAKRELERSVARSREETARALAGIAGLQSALSLRLFRRISVPLDGIISRARILSKEYPDASVVALSRAIAEEARAIGAMLRESAVGTHDGAESMHADAGPLPSGTASASTGDHAGNHEGGEGSSRVYLYFSECAVAERLCPILRAEGLVPILATDRYHVLDDSSAGKVDVLVIDASSADESAFSLCRLLRDSFSPVQLPMLLVTDFLDDLAVERGCAAGFNDFLTRPFDANALALRVGSLARLSEASSRNESLARSESEKNAFLYFLTHNVNTPLTVLINRVRELEREGEAFASTHEFDDIQASAREINDIVQNVLVSFRLSDGRQTLWLEGVDVPSVLDRVFHETSKKADSKSQLLEFFVPDDFPEVMADRVALHGILYNLVDNAIKFAPRGGLVSVRVSLNPVKVVVSDSGPGIRDEDRARLFGRFERLSARPTGGESTTGLGLYVARELAVMQGFELECPEGVRGGVFELTLWTRT